MFKNVFEKANHKVLWKVSKLTMEIMHNMYKNETLQLAPNILYNTLNYTNKTIYNTHFVQ